MKYGCGHEGCDICGTRTCMGMDLASYGEFKVCRVCTRSAIKFAIHALEELSVRPDRTKPCGRPKEQP